MSIGLRQVVWCMGVPWWADGCNPSGRAAGVPAGVASEDRDGDAPGVHPVAHRAPRLAQPAPGRALTAWRRPGSRRRIATKDERLAARMARPQRHRLLQGTRRCR